MHPESPGLSASRRPGGRGDRGLSTAARRPGRSEARNRRLTWAALVVCGITGIGSLVGEPVLAAETVVPFDVGGRLLKLTAEQRAAIGLWPGRYPHFQEARLLADSTGVEWIQVLWRDGPSLRQERLQLSAAEAGELRGAVGNWLALAHTERASGGARTLLLTASTITGLGFYSWGVPYGSDANGKTAVAVGMLAAGASFVLPYVATLREPVTPGMAHLSTYGLTRGIAYGMLTHRTWHGPGTEGEDAALAGVIGSAISGVGGYLWARQAGLDGGRAHLIEAGGDLGTIAAVEANIALGIGEDDGDGPDRSLEYAVPLLGAGIGISAGAILGEFRRPTWGDGEVFRTSSILTQGLTLGLWNLGTENERSIAGAAIAGSVLGAYLGDRLSDGPDFRANQAILMDLSAIAGGALTLGGIYLASSSGDNEDEGYILGASVGATIGYALAYGAFVRDAVSGPDTGGTIARPADDRNFTLSVHPRIRRVPNGDDPEVGVVCHLRF